MLFNARLICRTHFLTPFKKMNQNRKFQRRVDLIQYKIIMNGDIDAHFKHSVSHPRIVYIIDEHY